jgi:molybdate transport system substrate-binding protein
MTMRSKVLSLFLLIVLLATAACTPQATQAVPTIVPATAAVEATQAPTATALPTTAEATATAVSAKTVTVLAAASLTESFTELGKLFESQNPGVKVAFNFAGSQQLAQQLDQGADADVFASASKKYMDAAVTSKRVTANNAKNFVTNRLVVIFPKDNPAGLKELKDLAKPGLKLDLEDKSVPAGQYSLDFLDKAVKDKSFDTSFKDNVLKNVVSYETDVKAVVSKVSLGEADAGIVYITDFNAASDKLGKMDIPDALNTVATYPIAAISNSKNADLANAFVALVLSPDGQALMAKYGFIPAVTGSSSTGGFNVPPMGWMQTLQVTTAGGASCLA